MSTTTSLIASPADSAMRDFFISYTAADSDWAVWIAYELESLGFTVHIQAWDFLPGSNFMDLIDRASRQSRQTISVLSKRYLEQAFPRLEMLTALGADPIGHAMRLVPIRIESFEVTGILSNFVYIDLSKLSETEARSRLEREILLSHRKVRGKPLKPPAFPGQTVHGINRTHSTHGLQSASTARFINARVLASDWLSAATIGQPYSSPADPTEMTQTRASCSVTCVFWMPNDQYFVSGSVSSYTPAVAICTTEPQSFLKRVLEAGGQESFAKLPMAPSKLHNEDRHRLLRAIGNAADKSLIACIAVPKSIVDPASHSPSLGIQTLASLLVAPVLKVHTRLLGVAEVQAVVVSVGGQSTFLLRTTKGMTKAILSKAGIRCTVSMASDSPALECLGHTARLLAWASNCAHNAGNTRWIEAVEEEVRKEGGGVSRLETPPP